MDGSVLGVGWDGIGWGGREWMDGWIGPDRTGPDRDRDRDRTGPDGRRDGMGWDGIGRTYERKNERTNERVAGRCGCTKTCQIDYSM